MNTITSAPLRTLVAGAILSALTFSIATVSRADDGTTPAHVIVKFGDLDATRPAGMEELYRRLKRAARSVCISLDPTVSAAKSQLAPHYKACVGEAVSDAVSQINRPAFTDYVASRMKKPDHSGIQLAAR